LKIRVIKIDEMHDDVVCCHQSWDYCKNDRSDKAIVVHAFNTALSAGYYAVKWHFRLL
jgi:hypothetical protein